MNINIGNIYESIPKKLKEELINELINHNNVTIKRIVSEGHSSPESGWYDQEENEWVIILQGEAEILFENGDRTHLQSGSFLNIPAHTKHKVSWTTSSAKTIWLAVYY